MYATFDRQSPHNLSAEIHSLSWKGDERQGWLAAGNSRKTVGVTYTELKDWEEDGGGCSSVETELAAPPEVSLDRQGMRRNFNFREHSAEVRCSFSFFFPANVGLCSVVRELEKASLRRWVVVSTALRPQRRRICSMILVSCR